MTPGIDQARGAEPRMGIENATLAWVDALVSGNCTAEEFLAAVRNQFQGEDDKTWEVLSLLDQYYRRGKIKADLFLWLKSRLQGSALDGDEMAATVAARLAEGSRPRPSAYAGPASSVAPGPAIAPGPAVAPSASIAPGPSIPPGASITRGPSVAFAPSSTVVTTPVTASQQKAFQQTASQQKAFQQTASQQTASLDARATAPREVAIGDLLQIGRASCRERV